ncbi:MAG: tetratricopeptide repeat protein [Candidatus Syntrophosphaera sp.]
MSDKDVHNLILRAEALMKSNWIHAVQILNQAVEEHPNDPLPLIALGNFHQRRLLFQKAIKYFQSALKLSPKDNQLKLVIGNTYFAEGEYHLAIVYYDKIEDPHPDVRYNKALALAYMGKHEESIAIMRQLLDMIDNNPFIYFLLIEQLLRIEDYDSASEYLAKAESKIGQHRHLLLLKALNYAHSKNWLLAFNAFSEYEKKGNITQFEHIQVYADSALKSGMTGRAIAILEEGVEKNPYAMGLYEELIRLLIQQKEKDRARHYLRQAKRYFPLLSPLLQLMQTRLGRQED